MIKSIAKSIYRAIPAKRLLFRVVRATSQPSERIYRHLHFKGPFKVHLPNGRSFDMMHFGNQVENDLFWAGYGNGWEQTSLRVWAKLAARANIIFDIGANTGTYALAAKASNPSARVEAFEPVARIFDRLSVNANLNSGEITAHCVALSDHEGNATLFDSGEEHVYSASLNSEMLGERGQHAKTTVPVLTIDSFCDQAGIEQIDLLKIDAEMHEPEVIRGAKKTLARDKPAILIEILNAEIGAEIADLLIDYALFEIRESEGLAPAAHPGQSGERNYLALHKFDPRTSIATDGLTEAQIERLP